ncbi:TIGR03621 family F420-dependent LLM class oxidoreductase [Amycolatopsis pithecellobii]|uniref:TIGR03621 family F420-dependent LLM class oxidoreductase n=1 Tax=Amycolatopsis pithecellobii TaxID=664692 RepID=A0A6N7YKA0_9PSEU|nr:TIGR03621 family F420-dependent LLM class oxidoreductase [Amycolatopsis pithecellobii]MTD52442.1 TIGR03621 family F420-dependent LLM class oxidoreductase [Amycolatopsis pithecellobii]
MTKRDFRFGVNLLTPSSRAEWQARCRDAEDLGYDVIAVADHLGMPAPLPALVSAAEATTRPRLAVFALNSGFYNPVLLARDLAGTDALVDGRLEIALGTGYAKPEFDRAGIPWRSASERVGHLERTVLEVGRLLAAPEHRPSPVRRPPMCVAGNGDRVLRIAAEHADIVAFSGAAPGQRPGMLRFLGPDALAQRVDHVQQSARHRFDALELNLLVHAVALDGDRRSAIARLPRFESGPSDPAQVPTVLSGPPAEIAETLHQHRERYGFSYFTVPEPAMRDFARVIAAARS